MRRLVVGVNGMINDSGLSLAWIYSRCSYSMSMVAEYIRYDAICKSYLTCNHKTDG